VVLHEDAPLAAVRRAITTTVQGQGADRQ
jgi:hypothetical protein